MIQSFSSFLLVSLETTRKAKKAQTFIFIFQPNKTNKLKRFHLFLLCSLLLSSREPQNPKGSVFSCSIWTSINFFTFFWCCTRRWKMHTCKLQVFNPLMVINPDARPQVLAWNLESLALEYQLSKNLYHNIEGACRPNFQVELRMLFLYDSGLREPYIYSKGKNSVFPPFLKRRD